MTRINVGIDPKVLTNKHLLAEHREIKRIPNTIKSGRFSFDGQPSSFKLGTGHVKFFYDKLGYLQKRYSEIHSECLNRGFKVTNFSSAFDGIPTKYMKDYSPTEKDRSIVLQRINERLKASGDFK